MYLKLFLCLLLIFPSILAGDSVKLSNVDVLTLHHGKLTKGRRSAPVPQLQCIGGSARCAFTPQVVQCYNRGSDGQDVQWECKTDMDNSYRFGLISVSCEGYSYPDDPYILKGSCGLEYTLDLIKGGYKQQVPQHNYYSGKSERSYPHEETSFLGSLIVVAACCLIIYGLYKTCIAPSEQMYQASSTSDDFGGYPGGDNFSNPNAAPPPPGFHPNFTGGTGSASCGGNRGGGGGGFWTGAGAGGLLGYMLGRQWGNQEHRARRSSRTENYSRAFGGNSFNEDESGYSGTRTASGFGGTTRR